MTENNRENQGTSNIDETSTRKGGFNEGTTNPDVSKGDRTGQNSGTDDARNYDRQGDQTGTKHGTGNVDTIQKDRRDK